MSYVAIGLMSGTSLDGLDIVMCNFSNDENNKWNFDWIDATTFPYDDVWKTKLSAADKLAGVELLELHNEYGRFMGKRVLAFMQHQQTRPQLICSHGHTIFHEPEKGLTFQLGNGASIAAQTGITTVSDFRTLDVALGGQGAPLVPIGDKILFDGYDYCLNLGGFANISFVDKNKRKAFDISPVNIIINHLAQQLGKPMDYYGEFAKKGIVDPNLFAKLNQLDHYAKKPPKSLGKEWLHQKVFPLLHSSRLTVPDQLRTVYEHIAFQLKLNVHERARVLVTGGGAKNTFLMDLLKQMVYADFIIPDEKLVDFKEALIFALLGILRVENRANCLSSVTGARHDNIGGIVYKI